MFFERQNHRLGWIQASGLLIFWCGWASASSPLNKPTELPAHILTKLDSALLFSRYSLVERRTQVIQSRWCINMKCLNILVVSGSEWFLGKNQSVACQEENYFMQLIPIVVNCLIRRTKLVLASATILFFFLLTLHFFHDSLITHKLFLSV